MGTGPTHLGHLLLLQVHYQEAGREGKQPELDLALAWDVGSIDTGLTGCAEVTAFMLQAFIRIRGTEDGN